MKSTIFFITFISLTFAAAANPQRCNEIRIEQTYPTIDNSTILISATLNVQIIGQQNYLTITSFSSSSDTVEEYFDYVCFAYYSYSFCPNQTVSDQISNNETFGIFLANQTFGLWAHLNGHDFGSLIPMVDIFPIFGEIMDEGSFTHNKGGMFEIDNSCSEDLGVYSPGNGTQCCTSFVPVPPPSTSNRCKAFKSRTTIYNSDDNYSIYASAQINYTLTNETLSMTVSYTAESDEISVEFLHNDLLICLGDPANSINCNISIPSSDSKIFLQVSTRNGTHDYIYGVPIARLILRDNQALIEEGKPYDPMSHDNDCSYSNLVLNDHQVSSSSFCCTALDYEYEQDHAYSVPIEKFFSCQTPAKEQSCSGNFTQHLAAVENNCDVFFCLRRQTYKQFEHPVIQRPPFTMPQLAASNYSEHTIRATYKGVELFSAPLRMLIEDTLIISKTANFSSQINIDAYIDEVHEKVLIVSNNLTASAAETLEHIKNADPDD